MRVPKFWATRDVDNVQEAKRRADDAGEEARTTMRIIKMPAGERPRRERDGEGPGRKRTSSDGARRRG